MARMTQQEIFEILMDLHEVSNNDMMKKVYEICLKCLEDITSEITSVEDLPDIPFTNPIKKSLQMLLRTNRERDQQLKPTQTAMLPTQTQQEPPNRAKGNTTLSRVPHQHLQQTLKLNTEKER